MSKSLALLFRASLSVAFLLTATCIAHAQKTEASASIGPFSSEIEDEGSPLKYSVNRSPQEVREHPSRFLPARRRRR
jgi:hypothetical protein